MNLLHKIIFKSAILCFILSSNFIFGQDQQLTNKQKNDAVDFIPSLDTTSKIFIVKGKVFQKLSNNKEKPLKAIITLKGTNVSAYADKKGNYVLNYTSIARILKGGVILISDCKGYLSKETLVGDAFKKQHFEHRNAIPKWR